MILISVIIPAFNEAQRLPQTIQTLKSLCAKQIFWKCISEVLVVDDGSTDQTAHGVEGFADEWPLLRLIRLEKNCGKGAAVRRGMQEAKCDWVLVADADMATPWEELEKLVQWSEQAELIMGSRALLESQIEVRQHWLRQSMGKVFNRLQRLFVGLPYRDTQCGFKLIHLDANFRQKVLPFLCVDRFSWDIELILWLQKEDRRVVEVPVRWTHKESSRVHIIYDSIEMLWALYQMRRRIKNMPKNCSHTIK